MVDGFLDDAVGVGLDGRVAGDGETLRAGRGDPPHGVFERVLAPPLTATFAPALARPSASADPMAPPPPGMRATRPSRLNVSSAVIVLLSTFDRLSRIAPEKGAWRAPASRQLSTQVHQRQRHDPIAPIGQIDLTSGQIPRPG